MAKANIKLKVGIHDLPLDVWEHIFKFVPSTDIVTLSSVCKHFQKIVQTLVKEFDFSYCSALDLTRLLNYTLSASCTSINLNHCYWLKPRDFLRILYSPKYIQHFHIVECDVNRGCMETIPYLNLTSLSITYSPQWRAFFISHENEDEAKLRGFRRLKNLEIFYKDFPSGVLIEIYSLVLRHCERLESLKIFECISRSFSEKMACQIFPIRFRSLATTPVPELKSLTINVQTWKLDRAVGRFVALILQGKTSPLRSVDFGSQNGYLRHTSLQSDPRIIFDKSTLSINYGTNLNFWLNYKPAQNSINQKDYKKIVVKNVDHLDGLSEFSRVLVSNSRETLKEFHLKHHRVFENCDLEYWDGLSRIAINCHRITVFDISGQHLEISPSSDYITIASIRKNKALLNDLTHLKNLEKLCISPNLLHCRYLKSNGERCEKAMPFWKVTTACKSLIEIRIVYVRCQNSCLVDEDSLYALASCAKLKALHLVRFSIRTPTTFALSRITAECGELQRLHVWNVRGWDRTEFILNENIKTFSFSGMMELKNPFLSKLKHCTNLEKIYCDSIRLQVRYEDSFADVLRKLKNLKAIVVRREVGQRGFKVSEILSNERLIRIFKSLQDERAGFFLRSGIVSRHTGSSSRLIVSF